MLYVNVQNHLPALTITSNMLYAKQHSVYDTRPYAKTNLQLDHSYSRPSGRAQARARHSGRSIAPAHTNRNPCRTASISRMTLYNVENGDVSVSMGTYATILFVLGMIDRINTLADADEDALGRQLEEERLPKRIRLSRKKQQPAGHGTNVMMEAETLVYVDLSGKPYLVGRLWTRTRKEKDSATFEYDKDWLSNPLRFALEPALTLGPGPFHSGDRTLFGAIGDSAPDRWGRVLMRRAERRRAEREGKTGRTLREIDYLLMVDDYARQGALRFAATARGPFLAEDGKKKIPPLIELPRLLSAAEHVLTDKESDEDLRLLLAPGSSLGGARPKASVLDRDGQLAIAKFPHEGDEINAVLWEAIALTLATKAGINVPEWRLENVGKRPVLLLRRFDRLDGNRIPFVSAMSMLDARDNEQRSYMEFVDVLRQYGGGTEGRYAYVVAPNCAEHSNF